MRRQTLKKEGSSFDSSTPTGVCLWHKEFTLGLTAKPLATCFKIQMQQQARCMVFSGGTSLARSPAGGVQVSLAKEGVLWRRGVLAMPLIVRQALDILQALLDRLAAVELMLLQKPIVSGRYSGTFERSG